MEMLINALQSDIIEHLGRFGFLTVSQFRVLTGKKSDGYLREMLGSLKRKGYVRSYKVEVSNKVRAENMYFITPLAVEFLRSHKNIFADDLKLPVSTQPVVIKDYFHRMACVDIHLSIWRYFQANNLSLHFFYTYFDKSGSVKGQNLTAKTKIPLEGNGFYVPDGVFKSDKALYLLEQYSDKDSKRILSSLGTHSKAISLGTPANTFNMPRTNPCILGVFTHEGIKQAVIMRLQANENFRPVSRFYFFASLDDVKKDPGTAWQTITGESLVFT